MDRTETNRSSRIALTPSAVTVGGSVSLTRRYSIGSLQSKLGGLSRRGYNRNATRAVIGHHGNEQEQRQLFEREWQAFDWSRRARDFVDTPCVNYIVGAVIFMNAVTIYFETEGYLGEGVGSWSWVLELLFLLFYTVETGLRFAGYGPKIFAADKWNLLDLLLVLVSMVDVLIIAPLSGGDESAGPIFIIVVVLRLLRIIRLVRVVRMIRPLYLIIVGVSNSARAIAWSIILVFIVIFCFALAISHLLAPDMTLASVPMLGEEDMRPYFGKVSSTMFTLLQIMTYDDWPPIVRGAWKLNRWSMLFFMGFLACTSLSVLNVVMGIFVEGTISAARKNDENKAASIRRNHKRLYEELEYLFHAADSDGSGQVTREELLAAMEEEEFSQKLYELKITRGDICMLFDSLDLQDADSVDAREFIECLLCAREMASKKELLALSLIVRRSNEASKRFAEGISKEIQAKLVDSQSRLKALSADATRLAKLIAHRRAQCGSRTAATA